jgi:hypothetical protein
MTVRSTRLTIAFTARGFLLAFPPWQATFHPVVRSLPSVTVTLPWPNPSFRLADFAWAANHRFTPFVPVFTPPRPNAEDHENQTVGVWTTAVDVSRLAIMILTALVGTQLAYLLIGAFRERRGVRQALLRGSSSSAATMPRLLEASRNHRRSVLVFAGAIGLSALAYAYWASAVAREDPLHVAWEAAQQQGGASRSDDPLAGYTTDWRQRMCSAEVDAPVTGEQFTADNRTGHGVLTIDNGTGTDAVVALYDSTLQRTVRRFYVRAGDKAEIGGISPGTYSIRFAFGNGYSRSALRFCNIVGASEFDRPVDFTETRDDQGIRYSEKRLTLHKVAHGNARTHVIDASLVFVN